ncbi:MAG: class I SAM-dependent methyltransferase [Verrucomicrobia bacterium]|nr:class I SAM-dependent methyltransferase [Verrucomicrobiota bacterium]
MANIASPAREMIQPSQKECDTLFNVASSQTIQKVKERGDLPYATMQKQLEIIAELSSFDLGRFLLQERLIDGYWTDYVIRFADKRLDLGHLSSLERFMLTQAPWALATQQRFTLFQRAMQPLVKEGVCMGSVPCGMMRDLITLNFSGISEFSLVGVDIDPKSLELALGLGEEMGVASHLSLIQGDAWEMRMYDTFDVLTSNGLTLYEPSDEKVVALLSVFFRALKPGGTLVTSSVTFPPGFPTPSEWQMDKLSSASLLLQRIILVDIVGGKWQSFRSTDQMKALLEKAGFARCEVLYDEAHLFPTFVATK